MSRKLNVGFWSLEKERKRGLSVKSDEIGSRGSGCDPTNN